MNLSIFTQIVIFLLGLVVGSLLNVLIDRLPKEEQVLKGRSHCDHCYHQLAWFDLIPLLSFVFLRGRCRYCGKKISWQYPLVELITGVMFLIVSNRAIEQSSSPVIVTLLHCYIVASLIVIFFTDLKYGIIPDKIVYPVVVLMILFRFVPPSEESKSLLRHLGGVTLPISYYLLVAFGVAGFFWLLILLTKGRGMGFGDVKLAFLMGLILGFPKIIPALYFAFLTGALVSVILILSKRKKFGQTIPFGPFLVGGTIFSLFYGNEAIKWWLSIIM